MRVSVYKALAHSSFWLATLVMAVMGWTLYVAGVREAEFAEQVGHTQDVRAQVSKVSELARRAEEAQRGYLLSGSLGFVSQREEAFQGISEALAEVRKLTLFSRSQQLRVSQLEKLIAMRVARIPFDARMRRAVGDEANAKIRELINELRREELRLQREYRDAAEDRHALENRALVSGVGFGLIVLVPGYLAFVVQTRARRQTENMLRVMADSLPGAMYQLKHNPKGNPRLTFMGAGITRVCGLDAAGVDGGLPDWAAMVDHIDERDRAEFTSAMAKAMRSLEAFRLSYRVRHHDGTSRSLHHEASLLKQTDGAVLQNGYIADNTEQKRLEDALQDAKEAADAANRAKGTFLATMSHEIRTPMNGVLGMLELLSLTKLDGDQRSTLGIVRESGKSLLRIIDDILDFSKIEAGKLEVRPETASIADVLEGVRSIYEGSASSKGVSLRAVADPLISPALWVDPLRLRQILNNFVSNALKFTARGGAIEIRAELVERAGDEDRVRLSVKDTGVGISLEDQRHLFEPFSQVAGEGQRGRGAGTGLGLTICRRLASMMGGAVEMLSEPGVGTTITLSLSLKVADPAGLKRIDPAFERERVSSSARLRRLPPTTEEAEREGTLVLVVDDHPTNRMLLARQILALGYAAESAENGVAGLKEWTSGRFGLVVTDCNMPEMDGYEMTRAIRRLEAVNGTKRTPIIACTANALGGEAEICFAAGMDDYLVKPVELAQMLEKLNQWLPIPGENTMPEPHISPFHEAVSAPPVDRTVLARISGGDPSTERDILADFRRVNDEDAAALDRAVAATDGAQVTHSAHRMLGASRMVGAPAFASVCETIEHASREGDWTRITASMAPFHLEWNRLNTYLDTA
ncbi:MAG: response regulator [Vicinamibacteria bacterium]|jgi:signal transduction histidine kinase/CheY-like chemotaxis protein/CHASE3 domain sensor protein/HPt (histidine-containing phosphotransfer) domain-containing protein|nr:response regulator [Vicinamibacteria bacterium]